MIRNRNPFLLASIALIAASLAPSRSVRAADWPMWGGDHSRNLYNAVEKVTEHLDVEEGAKDLKWRSRLGSQSYGNPVIHKGRILVGTNNGTPRNPALLEDLGVVMCLRESDGEFLWQMAHKKLESGRVNDWPEQGVCSSPSVEGDRVYYVSNRCQVVCLDLEGFADGENDGVQDEEFKGPTDGDVVWMLDMMEEMGVFPHNMSNCAPLIVGDRLFTVTSNGVDEAHSFIPAPQAPSFVCLDKKTGEILWEDGSPDGHILHGQWSNPSYGKVAGREMVVFPGGDGWIYGLNPEDGSTIWKFDCNPKDSVYMLGPRGTRNHLIGTPILVDGRVYIAVGEDPEHGEGPGHFYCIDASKEGDITESGKVWHFKDIGRSCSTAAVSPKTGLVYVADLSGFLYCLDAKTGELKWRHDTLAAIWGSPFIVDGKVYQADEDGDVVVLDDAPEEKVRGEFNMGNTIYSTPVAANGVLYVMTVAELLAFAPGGGK